MSTTNTEPLRDAPLAAGAAASLKWWILGGCAAVICLSYSMLPAGTDMETHIGYMLRVTARLAFFFLMLAYLAQPLAKRFRGAVWPRLMVRNRRYFGLAMALAHTVHFGYVYALFVYTDTPLGVETAVFGGLAFVLMWLMAATSNNLSMRRLGANWRRLHTFGLHYLWLIFMQSYVGALFQLPFPWHGAVEQEGMLLQQLIYLMYVLMVIVGLGGLLLRMQPWFAQRSTRAR